MGQTIDVGNTCDDGDATTTGDVIQLDCSCDGIDIVCIPDGSCNTDCPLIDGGDPDCFIECNPTTDTCFLQALTWTYTLTDLVLCTDDCDDCELNGICNPNDCPPGTWSLLITDPDCCPIEEKIDANANWVIEADEPCCTTWTRVDTNGDNVVDTCLDCTPDGSCNSLCPLGDDVDCVFVCNPAVPVCNQIDSVGWTGEYLTSTACVTDCGVCLPDNTCNPDCIDDGVWSDVDCCPWLEVDLLPTPGGDSIVDSCCPAGSTPVDTWTDGIPDSCDWGDCDAILPGNQPPGDDCDDDNTLTLGDTRSVVSTSPLVCECTWRSCGDGNVDLGEDCDYGTANGTNGVACDALCKCLPGFEVCGEVCVIEWSCSFCGDGDIDTPNGNNQMEECDAGDANGTINSSCDALCQCEAGTVACNGECVTLGNCIIWDLAINKEVLNRQSTYTQWDLVEYELTVVNSGTVVTWTNVEISDQLPSGFTLEGGFTLVSTPWWVTASTIPSSGDNYLLWLIDTLGPGQQLTITYNVRIGNAANTSIQKYR